MPLNFNNRGPSTSSSTSRAGSAAYTGSTIASSVGSNLQGTAPSIAATGNTIAMQETYMQQQEALTQAGIANMARQAQLNFQKEMAELNAKTIGALAKSLSGLAPQ
ncbi:hypothetical protein [Acidovorax sp. PRC11]|uniref:hypothetical protein n=1 Tax=Acidovorax sp. PRC11 TaxID=2962592 RepID=UPI0028812B46|nr:hypothetical protein [Acidovorax sp. PRC11]MDT0139362.1 hypothetical protein [Acidovorax sp. PRC11]